MKTSININLFGTIYAIDEDAHQLLDQYLTSMKQYFSRQEGGEEIADDIEHRVAELFWELKQQGTESISIEQVTEIMHKIGNPEEMGESHESQSGPEQEQSEPRQAQAAMNAEETRGPRRYYRDGKDKILGGVLGGVCRYFGIEDPLWVRLGYLLLAILTDGILVVIYFLLWIVAPKATNAEERLKMQGKAVNPETLKSEVLNGTPTQPQPKNDHSGCLKVLLGMLLAPFGCLGCLFILVFLFVLFILFMVLIGFSTELFTGGHPEVAEMVLAQRGAFVLGIICLIILVALPLWGLWRWFRRDSHPTSSTTALIMTGLWLLALLLGMNQYNQIRNTFKDVDWGETFDWNTDRELEGDSIGMDSLSIMQDIDLANDFSQISFNGVGRLEFSQDSVCSVKVKGSEWLTKHTLISSENGKLEIALDDQANHHNLNKGLTIQVTAPYLTEMKLEGVGTVHIEGGLKQEQPFTLVMNGVGKVRSWDALTCPKVTLQQQGVGSSKVMVDTDSLIVSLDGVGSTKVMGHAGSYQRSADPVMLSNIDDKELQIGAKEE